MPDDRFALQIWCDRIATYLTFVLEQGWRDPYGGSEAKHLTLADLLTQPISTDQVKNKIFEK